MTTATYRSTADHAAEIRAALKAAGIKASVRCAQGSIDVRVSAGSVGAARDIACAHESIARDSITGEILCGGNRFVHVEPTETLVAHHVAALFEACVAALTASAAEEGSIERIAGTRYGVSWDAAYRRGTCWDLQAHGTTRCPLVFTARDLARLIASLIAEA